MALKFAQLGATAFLLLSSFTLSDATPSPLEAEPVTDVVRYGLESRAVPGNLPGGWTYLGCYVDNINARTLGGAAYDSFTAMNAGACIAYCAAAGYAYAGTEYTDECHCDNGIGATGVKMPDSDCNYICSAGNGESCGGSNRISIYSNAAGGGGGQWNALGCYTDVIATRTLTVRMAVAGGDLAMSIEGCQAACKAAGYKYSGVEYAQECWCDNAIQNGGGPAPDGNNGCNMACKGNGGETCGGAFRLNVYNFGAAPAGPNLGGWNALGCYTDIIATRTLLFRTGVAGGLTVEGCLAACQAGGYPLAGVEYGQECWCGYTFTNGGGPAPDGNNGCNMACQGNGGETCGGAFRLNVYSNGGHAAVLPAGWSYKGCWVDNLNLRTMAYQAADDAALTIEKCIGICAGKGYPVAGVQYSIQCFCDSQLRNGALPGAENSCNMACSGNVGETCGGPNRNSVYSNAPLQNGGGGGGGGANGWTYAGCLIVGQNPPPLFMGPAYRSDNQASTCLGSCAKFGYEVGGMIAGNQCYCGNALDVQNSGATFSAEGDCNVPCIANAGQMCGGNNRVSYYKYTGNPITVWTQPGGNGAGAYRVLVTGPVVPLIATLGIDNKVIFMEKTSTSETPGSTGTYELDLGTLQYRPLHVQSDVFCSAGLTLPDKAGRQIVVGGWSNEATYGVRLLTPGGDWQENYNEIRLAAGRWYPSAMIMANGSVLVVGGEQGANAAATPSLELLPGGGGAHYMDWLQSSDPWNLYPFLAVLPSGGVFVAYYQTARILDENSFGTIRVLPVVPGSILGDVPGALDVSVIGGRTYPLEGTLVILPQHAPYTDPLWVLMCGGSTPNGGPALDNCVSIQPEVPNQDWIIERMPSKRVLTCMAALPDGTYIIVNGAHVGTAGFGTQSDPNHQTLLYDPSKPVGQRIAILADADLDRLYHSEAILLNDGTVMISGSDPEAAPYIQEYRVEIFTPPYLMGNPPRSSFTIPNGNRYYGYNDQITIFVNGDVAKISLMGAVSSTHGNSMGQRTFFPAFNCGGGACTITTPPNAHVCPPGWFQVFIINGAGTPSYSAWVRIGGDPANLGAWPAGFADFTPPGSG